MSCGKLVFIGLITFYLVVGSGTLFAGIGASPTYLEISGAHGERLKGYFTVYNTGKEPLDVSVYFRKYFKLNENRKIGVKNWLHVRPMRFKLGTEGSREVKYIVQVPEKGIGEVMSLIFFKAPSSPGSNVSMSFGVSIYVGIEGTKVVKGKIEDVRLRRVIIPSGNVPPYYNVTVSVKNEGNVHIRPQIKMDLYRERKKIKMVDLPFGWPVFPNESYNYQCSLDLNGSRLEPGYYLSHIEVSFDGQVLKKKTAFFVDRDGNIILKRAKRL